MDRISFYTRNRLLRHVQRHAQTTALFAGPTSVQRQPSGAYASSFSGQAVPDEADELVASRRASRRRVPAAAPPTAGGGAPATATVRPATAQPAAPATPHGAPPRNVQRTPQPGPAPSTPVARVQPADPVAAAPVRPATDDAGEALDERTWQRLSAIHRRHQERQEAEVAAEGETAAATEAEVAGDTPSSLPLEAVWPVQRQAEAKGRAPASPGPAATPSRAAAQGTGPLPADAVPPGKTDAPAEADSGHAAEAVNKALRAVHPGRPTRSSVELVPPRRPRPASRPEADAKTPPDVQRTPAPAPETPLVETEIGALPADLWEILGEAPPVPTPAAGVSGGEGPADDAPADTGVVPTVVQTPESDAERPPGATGEQPAPVDAETTATEAGPASPGPAPAGGTASVQRQSERPATAAAAAGFEAAPPPVNDAVQRTTATEATPTPPAKAPAMPAPVVPPTEEADVPAALPAAAGAAGQTAPDDEMVQAAVERGTSPTVVPKMESPPALQRQVERPATQAAERDDLAGKASVPPVQRRVAPEAAAPAIEQATVGEETEAETAPIDLDALARQVYAELRRRLDVEWERLRRR